MISIAKCNTYAIQFNQTLEENCEHLNVFSYTTAKFLMLIGQIPVTVVY